MPYALCRCPYAPARTRFDCWAPSETFASVGETGFSSYSGALVPAGDEYRHTLSCDHLVAAPFPGCTLAVVRTAQHLWLVTRGFAVRGCVGRRCGDVAYTQCYGRPDGFAAGGGVVARWGDLQPVLFPFSELRVAARRRSIKPVRAETWMGYSSSCVPRYAAFWRWFRRHFAVYLVSRYTLVFSLPRRATFSYLVQFHISGARLRLLPWLRLGMPAVVPTFYLCLLSTARPLLYGRTRRLLDGGRLTRLGLDNVYILVNDAWRDANAGICETAVDGAVDIALAMSCAARASSPLPRLPSPGLFTILPSTACCGFYWRNTASYRVTAVGGRAMSSLARSLRCAPARLHAHARDARRGLWLQTYSCHAICRRGVRAVGAGTRRVSTRPSLHTLHTHTETTQEGGGRPAARLHPAIPTLRAYHLRATVAGWRHTGICV